ncbi:MAG: flagellar motor protein MotB [Arthrobacter sp.]
MSRRSGASRRTRTEPQDEHHDERWLVSYSDMVTVLFCLFLVLFAMSSVDQEKYEQVKNSLSEGFGNTQVMENNAAAAPKEPVAKLPQTDLERAIAEKSDLAALRDRINANLAARGRQSAVDYAIDQRGLTIRLVSSETFFEPNSADLSVDAVSILKSISPVLARTEYQVAVEGYADVVKPVHPYPTNWELSVGRSTAVVREMVERGGMDAAHMSSTGFGDARPTAHGTAARDLAANRRVDIVVLSQEAESVRALIPQAVAGRGG